MGRFIVKVGPGMSTLVSLRYPGFGVRVRVVSSCLLVFTDGCNSIILFCFLAIDNDIMRKMCTLITSKGTDIDENIANQNHATCTRTPKPGHLKLTTIRPGTVVSRDWHFKL